MIIYKSWYKLYYGLGLKKIIDNIVKVFDYIYYLILQKYLDA